MRSDRMFQARKALAYPTLSLLAFAGASLASAQDTRFAQTYTWLTESKGQHEVELKLSRLDDHTWLSENEFETGISERLTIAPYVNLQLGDDQPSIGGGALEMRYRFGDLRARTVLPAVYLEPQIMAGDPAVTIEARLIGTYFTSEKFDTMLSGNLVMERLMERGEPLDYGYSVGAVQMSGKGWLGAEMYGSWSDQEHFLGPTAGIKLKNATAIIFNFSFSLNKEDSQVKLILAHDF